MYIGGLAYLLVRIIQNKVSVRNSFSFGHTCAVSSFSYINQILTRIEKKEAIWICVTWIGNELR